MALPKWLFVVRMKGADGSTWLQASDNQAEAVEEAETSIVSVGTYQLIKTQRLSLVKSVKQAK